MVSNAIKFSYDRYLQLVRRLQSVYRLEPAGSHGVWGLDDYQFVSYIWGSGQLIDHPHIKPKSITNKDIVVSYAQDYIFLACIKFIGEMKTGPFHEHSPVLWDVSGVPHWLKVNKGLIKMFIAEVLSKQPIVQHFEFGACLPWEPKQS
jgi:serine/threonine-protein phosphatase 2A activator